MNEFKHLRKATRKAAIERGIIRNVAKRIRVSRPTVSRTFAGRFDVPNPKVVAALWEALGEMGLDERSSAA